MAELHNHAPVLLEEVLDALAIKTDGCYLDLTFGRGGHSSAILQRLGDFGQLLAMDRDWTAIESPFAQQMRKDRRFKLEQGRFSDVMVVAEKFGMCGKVDGILVDLGVSSPQLDDAGRGFSFLRDGPLDMRMDSSTGITAADWLASVDEKTLVKILFDYGEERFARRIASAIINQRANGRIETTKQLAELIAAAVPVKEKHKHPATRSFQAIRIEINQELAELNAVLVQAVPLLKPGGRLVVIAFHSLEDRIVKRFFRAESGAKYDPGRLPVKEADIAKGLLKTIGKAVKAGEYELANNIRARSAIMRVAERV